MFIAQIIPLLTHPGLLLGGTAAVAIPIAIHLLWRLRRQPQPWAAMRFLMQAYQKHRSRLRLEQFLLLAVRCLVLLIAGLAMSGPMVTGCSHQTGAAGTPGTPGKNGGSTGNSGGGGVIHLVIDDGLSSRAMSGGLATTADVTTRFEKLREAALAVVSAAGSEDRLAIWLSAQPVEVALPLSNDHAEAQRVLRSLLPRFSRSDLPQALSRVAAAVTQENMPADQTRVILLSDLSSGSLPLDKPMASEWSPLLQKAAFSLLRPALPVDNTQVSSLRVRQPMVVADPLGGTGASAELKLQRFGSAPAAATKVTLSVKSQGSNDVSWSDSKTVNWAAGQMQATMEVRFDLTAIAAETRSQSGALVTLTAALDHDALDADNTRLACVEYRSKLQISLVRGSESSATSSEQNRESPDPRRWLTLALDPAERANSSIETVDQPVANLTPASVAAADALLVLAPDQLTEQAWLTLRQAASRGAVVWFFTPPTNQPAIWSTALGDKLNVPWDLSIDPLTPPGISSGSLSNTGPATPASTPANAANPDESAWSLSLDDATPEPLKLLSADWQDLLRPVRVYKRLNVRLPQQSAQKPWISLSNAARSPLLVVQKLDQGHVVLLATALDPSWTNLTVKPLFVPLLHETLRSLLSESSSPPSLRNAIAGQPITLPPSWRTAEYLTLTPGNSPPAPGTSSASPSSPSSSPSATPPTSSADQPSGEVKLALAQLVSVPDNKGQAVARTTLPPCWPGVYRPVPALIGAQAAVNVDAIAGDTRTLSEEALAKWLTPAGPWQWLDPNNPLAIAVNQHPRTNWGWPLLLTAAILLALETLLARWFSHAKTPGATLWQSLWHRLITSRFSPGSPPVTISGGDAR